MLSFVDRRAFSEVVFRRRAIANTRDPFFYNFNESGYAARPDGPAVMMLVHRALERNTSTGARTASVSTLVSVRPAPMAASPNRERRDEASAAQFCGHEVLSGHANEGRVDARGFHN